MVYTLKIQGLLQDPKKNILKAVKKMGTLTQDMSTKEETIDMCHRLDKRNNMVRPLVIIVKFVRRADKKVILHKR